MILNAFDVIKYSYEIIKCDCDRNNMKVYRYNPVTIEIIIVCFVGVLIER